MHRVWRGLRPRLQACAAELSAPALCTVIVALFPEPACAQGELEEVIVTGTRIPRRDFESASPIVSVSQELFERTGSSTVETALNTLPQFVPGYTSTSVTVSNGGQANVQLRGLSAASTLVLIDGRRLVPANGTGVVDLNIIPESMIESVEIITGGASAVYGSEAIAGAINFRLKNHFDGIEFDALWGQTERGDGADYGGGVTAGLEFADGRGSALGYIGYSKREPILWTQRDFSRYVLAYVGPGTGGVGPGSAFVPWGAPSIEEGRVVGVGPGENAFESLFTAYGYPGRYDPRQTSFGVNADGTVFAQGTEDPGSVLNFRGERDPSFNDRFYTYNDTSLDYLQLPLERGSVFARARFEFSDAAELYAQGLYADYNADLQFWPTAMFGDVRMPPTNPFIPADLQLLLDSRNDPTELVAIDKRLSVLGPRVSSFEYDVYQATLGLRGDIFAGWTYDAYVQIGANDQTDRQSRIPLISRIEELTFAQDGGVSICGGFDPFGVDAIPAECLADITVDGMNRAGFDQTIFEASASGQLLQLPAGAIRVALGAFYKEDEYFYESDPIAGAFLPDGRPDGLGFSVASDDIDGEDENLDLYVEASIPLLKERPAARSLEVVAGYRHADYSSAGGTDAYKADLLYRPVDPFLLRGSLQRAVRAPSVFELFQPQFAATFFGFDQQIDPCEADSPQRTGANGGEVARLCLAQGVPLLSLPTFNNPDNDAEGFIGGNPDLNPETADTVTIGVVFTSPFKQAWLDRLQVSLDWYEIEVEGAIAMVSANDFIARCFDPTFNPGFDAANEWCGMFSRNETGRIVDAYMILRNTAGLRTTGVDVQLDWRLDLGPGELGVNWLVSYVDSFERLEAHGIPSTDLVGTVGSDFIGTSFPEWKWNLGLTYAWQALTLDAGWQYIDGTTDAFVSDFRVPHYDYFGVGASYDFSDGLLAGLRLHIGVENVMDEDPPIIPSWNSANTEASQYDVLGRRYYADLRYSF